MSIFYNPGPIPGWPTGKPRGSQAQDRPQAQGQPQALNPEEQSTTGARTVIQLTHATAAESFAHPATPLGELPDGERHPAEQRVRALRDVVQDAATRLAATEPVQLPVLHDTLWAACTAVQNGDLGTDGALIGQQFEAFFERLRDLAATHTTPVAPDSLGLPADARFLQDMAEYLTQRFALDAED